MKSVKENEAKEDKYWRNLNREWKSSGLSQGEFCKQQNISYSRFVYWRSKLCTEKDEGMDTDKAKQMEFATVKVNSGHMGRSQSEIKIRLACGVMIIADRETCCSKLKEILDMFGVLG